MDVEQHQKEILKNKEAWDSKPLLRTVYNLFYNQITQIIDFSIDGKIVELGSGVGNIKSAIPQALCTDIFPNPWLDIVCNAYRMPFTNHSVSNLIIFDVFHHLERPKAFLAEARRVLVRGGHLIIFEPYISMTSHLIYGGFHHEPVALKKALDLAEELPQRDYYAAQGNATRVFFRHELSALLDGWNIFYCQPIVSFSYVFSGGYSKHALYSEKMLPMMQKIDILLSPWPSLFASRCLVGLMPE
jgi:SAM-dependent methyltransferase